MNRGLLQLSIDWGFFSVAEDMFAFQVTVCLCISDYMTQISCGNFAPTEREELTVKSKQPVWDEVHVCACVKEGGTEHAPFHRHTALHANFLCHFSSLQTGRLRRTGDEQLSTAVWFNQNIRGYWAEDALRRRTYFLLYIIFHVVLEADSEVFFCLFVFILKPPNLTKNE